MRQTPRAKLESRSEQAMESKLQHKQKSRKGREKPKVMRQEPEGPSTMVGKGMLEDEDSP